MYFLVLPSRAARQRLIESLKRRGIMAVFHYVPLHTSPMGQQFGGRSGQCPVSEWAGDRLLRLPFYNSISEEEQSRVLDSILAFDC
jgi:dTDP-4-amino-4,6-dideoxygalactose transaminase